MQAITAGFLAGISDTAAQKLSGFQRIQLKRLLLKVVRANNDLRLKFSLFDAKIRLIDLVALFMFKLCMPCA